MSQSRLKGTLAQRTKLLESHFDFILARAHCLHTSVFFCLKLSLETNPLTAFYCSEDQGLRPTPPSPSQSQKTFQHWSLPTLGLTSGYCCRPPSLHLMPHTCSSLCLENSFSSDSFSHFRPHFNASSSGKPGLFIPCPTHFLRWTNILETACSMPVFPLQRELHKISADTS